MHTSPLPDFTRLHDDCLLALPEAAQVFTVSKATFRRRVAAGLLPAPVRVSARRVAWRWGALREALARLQAGLPASVGAVTEAAHGRQVLREALAGRPGRKPVAAGAARRRPGTPVQF